MIFIKHDRHQGESCSQPMENRIDTKYHYALLAALCQISGLYDEKHPTALVNNAVRVYYWDRFMIMIDKCDPWSTEGAARVPVQMPANRLELERLAVCQGHAGTYSMLRSVQGLIESMKPSRYQRLRKCQNREGLVRPHRPL